MITTPIKASAIQMGDLIASHGVIFRITSSAAYPSNLSRDHTGTGLPLYVHQTEIVVDNSHGHFPKSWQSNYTIQSNDLHTWGKVDESELARKEVA